MNFSIPPGQRRVGNGFPVYVIAEAGVNHNGSKAIAKQLIDAAAELGADAIKFQTFKAEDLTVLDAPFVEYQKRQSAATQQEMLRQYELTTDDFKALKKYCDSKGITFLSTPHTINSVDVLQDLVPAFKIGSGDALNIPLLTRLAMTKKPLIIGTGMTTLNELKKLRTELNNAGVQEVVLLHCTTAYPCPLNEVNMRALQTMKRELGFEIGYSDHTPSVLMPSVAVALGAVIIEKHFTFDRNMIGPDHLASMNPEGFKTMLQYIRDTEIILCSEDKKRTTTEEKNMPLVRKSIVALEDIPAGTILREHHLCVKRPGVPPEQFDSLLGKKTKLQ